MTQATVIRAIGVVAFFAVLAPIIGMLSIALLALLNSHSRAHWFFPPPGDFVESILEFGVPSAFAGVLFFIAVRRLQRRSITVGRFLRAALAGAAFAAVIGIPLLAHAIQYSHVSKNGFFFVVLAAVCGLIVGLACPPSWLAPDGQG